MKESFDDLQYLLEEMRDLLNRTKRDIPEDFYKVYSDLVYHSFRTLNETEVKYAKLAKTWDRCLCELQRLSGEQDSGSFLDII